MKSNNSSLSRSHRGLTVLEVLFAIGIVLVGLVGIAAMVPFAGRQAAQSYSIAHGLASGANTLAVFQSDVFLLPSSDRPWLIVDDSYSKVNPNIPRAGWVTSTAPWALVAPFGATNQTFFPSFERLYDGNRARQASLYRFHLDTVLGSGVLAGNPRAQVALAQNRALGQGFCIDPYFYSEQFPVTGASGDSKVSQDDWRNIRRSRFPFYNEQYDPSTSLVVYPRTSLHLTPRLLRTTFRDPSLPLAAPGAGPLNVAWLDKAWARGDAARMSATVESRDLVADKTEDNLVTTRQFVASGSTFDSVIKSADSNSMLSWLATVTPVDSTPIVNPLSLSLPTTTYLPPMEFFPESYDVSIVVFAKRDVREVVAETFADFRSVGAVPQSERIAKVTDLSPDSASSGTFEVELDAFDNIDPIDDPGNVNARIVIGDWIMLSRHVYDNPLTVNIPIRDKHRWYRVVGVTGLDTFPRRIRVAGVPWDWSIHELDAIRRLNAANPSITVPLIVNPASVPTVATILKDVVTVYQRTLSVSR